MRILKSTNTYHLFCLLALVQSGVCSSSCSAEADWRVFQTEQEQRQAGQMLADYQQRQILSSLAHRDATVASLTSADQILARAREARRAFIESIGGLAVARCPLAPKLMGTIDRGSYRIEKVIYQSRPNFWVTANLYIPSGFEGRQLPAVLAPMGHTEKGKSARWFQQRAIGLVRLGYVVLGYDQVGLGERWQYWDPNTGLDYYGHRKLNGEINRKSMVTTQAHSAAGNQVWLVGDSLAQYVVWDAVRGIDYLLTRPEVDPERIACSGASMGGLATMVLTAVDSRLKASVPVSHVTKRRHLVKLMMARDAEQVFLRCYCDGWEHADLLLPIVLNDGYLQIIGNTKDFFPIEGTRQAAEELGRLFKILGKGSHFRFVETPHGHGWCRQGYEGLHRFLRYAFGQPDLPTEHTVNDEDYLHEKQLWCTPEGQICGASVNSETVFSLTQAKAEALRPARRRHRSPESIIEAAKKRIMLETIPQDVKCRQYPKTEHMGISIERWAIQSEPGIWLPALLMRGRESNKVQPRTIVVYASPLGKQNVFESRCFPLHALLEEGATVLAVDVRGWGELRWRKDPEKPVSEMKRYTAPNHGEEWILTYNALRNGQTMVGQRAFDLVAASRWILQHVGNEGGQLVKMWLWGEGELGVAALHALALCPADFDGAVCFNTLYSYDDWACTRFYDVPVGLIIPGILKDYDLGTLVWAVRSVRKESAVLWVNPIDAIGQKVTEAAFFDRLARDSLVAHPDSDPLAGFFDVCEINDWNRVSKEILDIN
jgi:hypothetical protein